MKNSIVQDKSFQFAVDVVRLCQHLADARREFILSNQLARSATSIGANIREARRGQSEADFVAKMSISLKEAEESRYWLELLQASNYISDNDASMLLGQCDEIIKMLSSIIKTMKARLTLNS